jgi:hypothetical protein
MHMLAHARNHDYTVHHALCCITFTWGHTHVPMCHAHSERRTCSHLTHIHRPPGCCHPLHPDSISLSVGKHAHGKKSRNQCAPHHTCSPREVSTAKLLESSRCTPAGKSTHACHRCSMALEILCAMCTMRLRRSGMHGDYLVKLCISVVQLRLNSCSSLKSSEMVHFGFKYNIKQEYAAGVVWGGTLWFLSVINNNMLLEQFEFAWD